MLSSFEETPESVFTLQEFFFGYQIQITDTTNIESIHTKKWNVFHLNRIN